MEPTRDRAWETLTRYTKSEALLRHALAVEAALGAYATRFGEDEQLWRVTALLHDFDYEIHPTLDQHPQDGAPILREEGYPEEVIVAVLSMFAVPVTGPLNWFTTHVVTPPAASGSVEPKKNSHVPPEHDELSVQLVKQVVVARSHL